MNAEMQTGQAHEFLLMKLNEELFRPTWRPTFHRHARPSQLLGARINKENAAKRRKEIARLAKGLWEQKPGLKNNLSGTAREIESMKHDALKLKGKADYLGADAIRKHLSSERKKGRL
jgi:hypothetical protein